MKSRVLKALSAVLLVLIIMLAALPAAAAPRDEAEPGGEELFSEEAVGGGPTTYPADRSGISLSINGESSDSVKILVLLTIVTLIPSILLMMTCFTRIVIVFSLLRNAIGLQQTPPNQIIIGLSLFLTLFIMSPVISTVNETAYKPYSEGLITTEEFLETAEVPVKDFMLKQTKSEDMNMFVSLANIDIPDDVQEYPLKVVIPAFMTSELKRAFTVAFFLFIPFLIIDMVVASVLMSMGMMMLPPVTISLPFKLMLFVLADGWGMLIRTLVTTYNV